MKKLLKILVGGFLAFMALSIVDQWEFFASSWLGSKVERPSLSEQERKQAADAVHMMLTLMRHYYSSGGDPRFAERMPAAEGVLDEMAADVEYLARNHRVQDMELVRLDVTSVDELGRDRVEIRTREHWRVRIRWAAGGSESEAPTFQTVHGKYLVVSGGRGWRVEGWDHAEPAAATGDPTG